MNNLLDFLQYREYIREEKTWKKINITPKDKETLPDDGTVKIKVDGTLDSDIKHEVEDILADDYKTLIAVTGKNNVGGFMEYAKAFMPYIAKMKNSSNGVGDEEPRIFTGEPSKDGIFSGTIRKMESDDEIKCEKNEDGEYKKIINKNPGTNITSILYNLSPEKNKNMGKGELLLASYYSNVKRSLEKNAGGEPGDCVVFDGDNKTGYIEVKGPNAQFYTIDKYSKIELENKIDFVGKCSYTFSADSEEGITRKSHKSLKLNDDEETVIKIGKNEKEIEKNTIKKIILSCVGGIVGYIVGESKNKSNFKFLVFDGRVSSNKSYAGDDKGNYPYYCMDVEGTASDVFKNLINMVKGIEIQLPKSILKNDGATLVFNAFNMNIHNGIMYIHTLKHVK